MGRIMFSLSTLLFCVMYCSWLIRWDLCSYQLSDHLTFTPSWYSQSFLWTNLGLHVGPHCSYPVQGEREAESKIPPQAFVRGYKFTSTNCAHEFSPPQLIVASEGKGIHAKSFLKNNLDPNKSIFYLLWGKERDAGSSSHRTPCHVWIGPLAARVQANAHCRLGCPC